MLLLLPLWLAACTPDESRVRFELSATSDVTPTAVQVETRWQGELRSLPLVEQDGVWAAEMEGPSTLYIPVTVQTERHGRSKVVFQSVEVLEAGDQVLRFVYDERGLRRSDAGTTLAGSRSTESLLGLFGIGWALLALVLARTLLRSRERPSSLRWSWWWSPLFWAALATAWTWPALRAGSHLVGRHFDTLGTAWSISAAPRLLREGLIDPLTAFPELADYRAFDSFLLLPLASALAWLDPARAHGWLQILGLALSAWAAEGFAREVGARRPWTLLAGISFAFSGLAAWALLEGHVYHLFNPWLPLFARAWWRALHTRQTPLWGALAALGFVATLLTTGYLGMSAALVAVLFFAGAVHKRRAWLPAVTAAVVVAPFAAAYVHLMGSAGAAREVSRVQLQLGSASLLRLAGPTPELDRAEHSSGLALCAVSVALCLLAPRLIKGWKSLLLPALVALLLGLGPALQLGDGLAIPLPLGWLADGPLGSLVRFPARLMWVCALCLGALAARVATELEHRRGTPLLLVMALVGVFVVQRVPWRQAERPAALPSVYALAEGPVLDFFPEAMNPNGEQDAWFTGIACWYQARHGLPIADDCVAVPVENSPRVRLSRELAQDLLLQRDEARERLETEGFVALAVHPDSFREADRARLQGWLPTLGSVHEGQDGADRVWMVLLGDPTPVEEDLTRPRRLDLRLREATPGHRQSSATLRLDGEVFRTVELLDDGVQPNDWARDRVRVASFDALPVGDLELEVSLEGVETWRGPLRAAHVSESLSFLEEDGVLRPALTVPYTFSPRIGWEPLPSMGWLIYLLVAAAALLTVRTRRARRSSPSTAPPAR